MTKATTTDLKRQKDLQVLISREQIDAARALGHAMQLVDALFHEMNFVYEPDNFDAQRDAITEDLSHALGRLMRFSQEALDTVESRLAENAEASEPESVPDSVPSVGGWLHTPGASLDPLETSTTAAATDSAPLDRDAADVALAHELRADAATLEEIAERHRSFADALDPLGTEGTIRTTSGTPRR